MVVGVWWRDASCSWVCEETIGVVVTVGGGGDGGEVMWVVVVKW